MYDSHKGVYGGSAHVLKAWEIRKKKKTWP